MTAWRDYVLNLSGISGRFNERRLCCIKQRLAKSRGLTLREHCCLNRGCYAESPQDQTPTFSCSFQK